MFVGIRRAGKTYMLYQYIQQLVNEGHDIREILFVNFEDERISDMKKEDLHTVIDAYRELFAYEPVIFLDEIQNIDGWEHFARRLADENRRVFITGSNAHMLSREIASTLGGRFLIQEIWPFSFSEYLQYKGVISFLQCQSQSKNCRYTSVSCLFLVKSDTVEHIIRI